MIALQGDVFYLSTCLPGYALYMCTLFLYGVGKAVGLGVNVGTDAEVGMGVDVFGSGVLLGTIVIVAVYGKIVAVYGKAVSVNGSVG